MNNIVVTGGAGYIGSHICKALKMAGYTPVTIDNLSRGHKELVKYGPLKVADILDKKDVKKILSKYKPKAVIHCAGYIAVGESVTDPALYYRQNVVGTLTLLDAMVESLVENIIFSSSCAVHGIPSKLPITEDTAFDPISPYGRNKLMMEQAIQDYSRSGKLKYTILRYFNACGADAEGEVGECHEPETHLIPLAIKASMGGESLKIFGADYPTEDGTAVRDYIHVSDVAHAHVLALKSLLQTGNSDIFNLGIGKGYSVKQIIDAAEKSIGRKIPAEYAPRRAGDPPVLLANIDKIQSKLGFKPQHSSLENIISTAYQWESKRSDSGH